MSADRIDDLLEEALATGTMPAGMAESERAELGELLAALGMLETIRLDVEAEAGASMPMGRARFQRYVAGQAPTSRSWLDAISRPHLLPWGRMVPRGVTVTLAGSAAAIAVVAVAAVVLWRTTLGDPESAYAQVVEPGDYVQIEGIVEEATEYNHQLRLTSVLGDIEVTADQASLSDGDALQGVGRLRAGERVLVSGIAGEGRKLVAQTVAINDVAGAPPGIDTVQELRLARGPLEGVIVTYAISSEGDRASVVIEAPDGTRYQVPVDGDSATRLLEAAATALGRRVAVRASAGSGPFTVELRDDAPSSGVPELTSIRGIVLEALVGPPPTGGGGLPSVTLTVQTTAGRVTVRVPGEARSYVGRSGIEAGPRLLLRSVGHAVSISGSGNSATAELTADVLVVGPKAQRPSR